MDSSDADPLPTKLCSVCDCYVSQKNWEGHVAGKAHRKKAAKSAEEPTTSSTNRRGGVKRTFDQASLARSEGGGGGAGCSPPPPGVRPTPRQCVVDWLVEMRDYCATHADFARQYSELRSTAAQLSTNAPASAPKSALWSAFRDGDAAGGGSASSATSGAVPPKIFAIDCEMVLCEQLPLGKNQQDTHQKNRIGEVGAHGKVLARVSVVEWEWGREEATGLRERVLAFAQGKPVKRLDEFVRLPDDVVVVDYLTHVSGVEEKHVRDATLALSDVHAALRDLVDSHDIVIGHSLWADFGALELFHDNFLDTAMLFTIQDIPKFTPSLKDVVDVMFETTIIPNPSPSPQSGDTEEGGDNNMARIPSTATAAANASPPPAPTTTETSPSHGFQAIGGSHDSVEDASWAIRVLALRMSMEGGELFAEQFKDMSTLVPYSLPALPPRFKKRVTFQRLPAGSTEETVLALLRSSVPDFSPDSVTIRPLKWIEPMVNGARRPQGSCIVEFGEPKEAVAAFAALPCSLFEGTFPRAAGGHPDRHRFLRKFTPLKQQQQVGSQGGSSCEHECEVLSYVRVGGTKPWHVEQIQQSLVGKLMGRRGRRLLKIQQCCGCLVQVDQVRASASSGKRTKAEGKAMATLQYWADSRAQAMQAREQVARALGGDDLGIV